MKRTTYHHRKSGSIIRLIAETIEEREILKDLVSSKINWLEVDVRDQGEGCSKGYIDLVDEKVTE